MIKNLIFDYGGVLLDWNPHYYYDKYFGSREKADWFLENVCPYEWNIKQDAGRDLEIAYAERIAVWPEYEKEIRMYYAEFMQMMHGQLPGMEECLRELKKTYHLFGLSNWNHQTFAIAEKEYPILKLLEDMVISGREGIVKPSREIFQLAIERFGIIPEESIFIDDRLDNIEAARACGLHGIQYFNKEQMLADIAKISQK